MAMMAIRVFQKLPPGKPSPKSTPQNSILEIRFYLKEEKCGEKMWTRPQSLKLEGNVQCQALTPFFSPWRKCPISSSDPILFFLALFVRAPSFLIVGFLGGASGGEAWGEDRRRETVQTQRTIESYIFMDVPPSVLFSSGHPGLGREHWSGPCRISNPLWPSQRPVQQQRWCG